LIEMLVVILIMGLFIGLVSAITRPDDRAVLRVEAERLAQLLDLAAAQSRLTGKSIAWVPDEAGYRFWQSGSEAGWTEVGEGDLLRARTLPQGMRVTGVQVENRRVQDAARVEFVPYGQALSFNVEMALGAERYTVAVSPVGDVRTLPGAEKPDGDRAL
jgi:general secretion pathway protein H